MVAQERVKSMTSAERLLHDLDARDQIRRITADYVQGIDRRNREQFEKIWAHDAVWQPSPSFRPCTGKEEIVAMLEEIWANQERTHHWAMNHAIDVNGDRATATTDLLSENLGRNGVWHRAAATHHDYYEKRHGRWLLVRRTCEIAELT